MERPRRNILVAVGLVLYGLVVAALAAHYTFPYQAAAGKVQALLQAVSPLRLEFEGLHAGRPFVTRIKAVNIGLDTPVGVMDVFQVRDLALSPRLLGLLTGRLQLDIDIGGGGSGTGQASLALWGEREMSLSMKEIGLPDFLVQDPVGQGQLQGPLTGWAAVRGRPDAFPTDGEGEFEIGPGRVEGIHAPQLPMDGIDFDKAAIKFKIQGAQIIVEQLTVESPQGAVNLTGKVSNLRTMALSLSGQARMGPKNDPMATATLTVTGPLTNPKINITNMRMP